MMRVHLEERFRSERAFNLRHSCGARPFDLTAAECSRSFLWSRGEQCCDRTLPPVVAILANEVINLAEGL